MRSCPVCGARVAQTDDFCGNCGSYLGWGTGTDRSAEDGPPATNPVRPAPHSGADDAHAARAAHVIRPGDTEPRADQPGADQPGAVQPAKPLRPRLVPVAPVEQPDQDGPPCPRCGTPNPPGRRFCRRCAAPLDHVATASDRVPWWRAVTPPRWFGRGGTGSLARRLVILAVLVTLVLGAILLWPVGVRLFENLRDKTSTPAPIGPVGAVASAEVPGHPAAAATDGLTNRYWGVPAPGDGIEFTFDHPFRLLSLVIHAGASAQQEQFSQQGRPAGLDVIITNAVGESTTLPVELADQPGPQHIDTGLSDVVRIRIVVRSAVGLTPGRHIAFGEIEFFQRP